MNCNQCGAEAPASAAYCSQCGAQLNSGVGMTAADRQTGAARMQAGSSRDTSRNAPEEELWAGTYAPKAIAGPFVGAALLTALGMVAASFAGPVGWIVVAVGALLMFGYLGLLLLYRRLTVRYRLTTQRLLRETGILSRTDDRILVIEHRRRHGSPGIRRSHARCRLGRAAYKRRFNSRFDNERHRAAPSSGRLD